MKHRLSALFSLLCVASVGAAVRTEHPNVVFFLVDDMGWRDSTCYGSELYETPNLDRLASEGVRFTQAYSSHPRCVPARYSFMTGKFPARDGIPGASYNMDAGEFTLAEAMKAGGYATFFAGKWHLQDTDDQAPENQGFDINIAGGHAGAPGSYFFPYTKAKNKNHKTEAPIRGLEDGVEGEYLTDRLTDETIEFIEANTDHPFLVYLSHYAVHTPLEAKPELVAYYENKLKKLDFDGPEYIEKDGTTKMRQDNAVYAAMVHSMDESLGRVMESLDKLGLADETVIVFTSDHGGLSNRGVNSQRPLATSNLPLRAGKGHLYEGGIRVPMVVKWPGVTKAGAETTRIVTGSDHYPSVLEMAGLPLRPQQHLDGISYTDTLEGKDAARSGPVFWHSPMGRPNQTGDTNSSVIRDGDWKLFEFFDEGRVELYNIAADPYETTNLATQRPDISKPLLEQLHQWKQDVSAFIQHK
ncbi:sulfatase [Tichowtungia aerotolerans]|uniref:Sulfatase-like hydrolase/transferase n=1 Tax=Tichowtungia aerotolerans TaxID=2697043 RepID=A0A6P1M5G6_9BACT|nr:sulfatase [Tichowtungia aerotolerans]QHI69097.1 sulfatase-like hydrolase/transferase [Tichowtungia aerotolerans]